MNGRQIRFAVNTHGKDKEWNQEILASKYKDKSGTLQDVFDHVKQGHAIAAGLFGNRRRNKANVIGSEWVLLDIDNEKLKLDEHGKQVFLPSGKKATEYDPQLTLEQALEHPFIKQHCALIYTSFSHQPHWHKFRLVFLLPEYETDVGVYEAMVRLLMKHLPHDAACKDASRVFYGSTKAERPLFNPDAVLPVEWRKQAIAALAEEVAKKEQDRQAAERKQAAHQARIERGEVTQQDTDSLALSALYACPPRSPGSGNYPESIRLLMALVTHFGESEAERIAEAWSPSIKGTTWNIPKKIHSFKRSGGVGLGTLFYIAKQYGWKFPARVPKEWQEQWQETEPTTTNEEWEWKHGLPNCFRDQVAKVSKLFKGFGKQPQSIKPSTLSKPAIHKYVPGELPTPAEYKAMGCPVFPVLSRYTILSKAVRLGENLLKVWLYRFKRYNDVCDFFCPKFWEQTTNRAVIPPVICLLSGSNIALENGS